MIRKWFSKLTDKDIKKWSVHFFAVCLIYLAVIVVIGSRSEVQPLRWTFWLEMAFGGFMVSLLEGGIVYGVLKLGRRLALKNTVNTVNKKG